jgi:hypothetical protein
MPAAIISARHPSIRKQRQTPFRRSETGPGRLLREMLPGQHNADPDEHAQNKSDHEAKTSGVLN